MTLSSRAVAIQGFSFSPIMIAVQGLLAELEEEQTGGSTAAQRARSKAAAHDEGAKNYIDWLNRQAEQQAKAEQTRRRTEEEAIIMAVVQFVIEEA